MTKIWTHPKVVTYGIWALGAVPVVWASAQGRLGLSIVMAVFASIANSLAYVSVRQRRGELEDFSGLALVIFLTVEALIDAGGYAVLLFVMYGIGREWG
jgi:hypothetical protein